MVNSNALRAEIIRKGKKPKEMYEKLGISRRMWYWRLENKQFSSTEIQTLRAELELSPEETCEIFFA